MRLRSSPFFWSGVVMALAAALTLYVASLQKVFVENVGIASPDVPAVPVLAYFFGAVAVVALVLFTIPVSRLRLVFRLLFTLMYAWGAFVIVGLVWPTRGVLGVPLGAALAAVVAGAVWLLLARVWVHDLLLMVTLSAAGSLFGFFFSPWTFLIFMLLVSVYDFLAVRFGFMTWMAGKLSEVTTLPAFIFPREMAGWASSLRSVSFGDLARSDAGTRQYSVLGGGDIGLPLMLSASVYFDRGLAEALVVSVFAGAGLMCALLIQQTWMKGRPIPALPPIAAFSLVGFLLTGVLGR